MRVGDSTLSLISHREGSHLLIQVTGVNNLVLLAVQDVIAGRSIAAMMVRRV